MTVSRSKRRRGAPEANAVQHGFYARQFRQAELADLEAIAADDLGQEIAMLRVVIRRTLALADELTEAEEAVKILNALSAASTRLASLMRSQLTLNQGRADETIQALSAAIAEVTQELRLG